MSTQKTAIVTDTTALVAAQAPGSTERKVQDVIDSVESNRDSIRNGLVSVSSDDTHVKDLADALVAGGGIDLPTQNDAADETLTVVNTEHRPKLVRVDNDTLAVGTGANATQTIMELATAGNWIGGSSLESASEWVHVYEVVATPGIYKLSDKQPQYSAPATANRIANMQVNQAGWDGTAAQGLNATSVIYDNGTTGDDVPVGSYALIYSDASFTLWRGRGSGAAGAVTNLSVAKITATTAGEVTGTLTLEAGHQIAINDDDYIIVIDAGIIDYWYDGSAWYRHIGAWWNDSSGHLLDLSAQYGSHKQYHSDQYIANEGSDYTTSSTSFVDIDGTNLALVVNTRGGDVQIGFTGIIAQGAGGVNTYLEVEADGAVVGGDDGIVAITSETAVFKTNAAFTYVVSGLPPGKHTFVIQWKVFANTSTLFAGAGTANGDLHPQFWAKEV